MRLIEQWFEPVRPSQDYRRQDYILLFLILAVGTWLRFWHLGNVGLHGDEDIMGLAARGVVEQGAPILPSGMFYPRALLIPICWPGPRYCSATTSGPSGCRLRSSARCAEYSLSSWAGVFSIRSRILSSSP